MENFKKLGLSEKNLYALSRKGFKKPTKIQELTIPVLLKENIDIIAQAQTGTGKTAAFGLPLIENIEDNGQIQALILAPTRELVLQVCDEINSLKGKKQLSIIPVYGGQSIDIQFKKLKKNVSVVVGTPGRILDHLKRKTLNISKIKYFILDEADEMLNMGFIDDIETIFNYSPKDKRVLLFSATMPERIKNLAANYMKKYKFIKASPKITTNLTEQIYYEVNERDKLELLCRIIDMNENFYSLIFCQTKVEVDKLANELINRGYSAEPLHGNLSQAQRERTLKKFRKKIINILVATDVAARGIDITDLTHVINYSVPQNPEIYIHRIGRTGRAGKNGKSITFVTRAEFRKFNFIKKINRCNIKKGNLPDLSQISEIKKNSINEKVLKNLKNYDKFFRNWARELLINGDFEDILSSLLMVAFSKDFYFNNNRNDNQTKKVRKIINKTYWRFMFFSIMNTHNASLQFSYKWKRRI